MSRIGKRLLPVATSTKVEIHKDHVTITDQLGTLKIPFNPSLLTVALQEQTLSVTRKNEAKQTKMLHGTTNALLKNALQGVVDGHVKKLKITGVGYRCAVTNNVLNLNLGYSHPVQLNIPVGLQVSCPQPTEIIIKGADKAMVGQLAAVIRSKRPPEPYKGKGVAYHDEIILRKVGKTAEGSKK